MNHRGFTLIELLVAIGILGILAAMALPRITASSAERNVDLAARELAADLRWMQQQSINSGAGSTSPYVAPDSLPYIQFNSTIPYGYYITQSTQTIKQVNFPAGVRINVPPSGFSFNINGVPTTNLTISLQSGTAFRNIYIDSPGRVRVHTP